jgi:hypothetical protein
MVSFVFHLPLPDSDFHIQFFSSPPRTQQQFSLHPLHNLQYIFLLESLWLTASQPHQSSIFSLTVFIVAARLLAVSCHPRFAAVRLLHTPIEAVTVRSTPVLPSARSVENGCGVASSTFVRCQGLSTIARKVAGFPTPVTGLVHWRSLAIVTLSEVVARMGRKVERSASPLRMETIVALVGSAALYRVSKTAASIALDVGFTLLCQVTDLLAGLTNRTPGAVVRHMTPSTTAFAGQS